MTQPTDALTVVTQHLVDIITAVKDDFSTPVQDVYYGDEQKIPRTPAVCVFASVKRREIDGMPRRSSNILEVYIHVYAFQVGASSMKTVEADQLAEEVEAVVHADPTLAGLVIHSLVVTNESGYLARGGSTGYKGNRLTVQATSKTTLPMAPSYNQP